LHFFVAPLVRDFEMIRSPEPFFAAFFFFAAIISPVSSAFPSITVDAQRSFDNRARQDLSVNSSKLTPMSHITAWFDRRIIDLLFSEANQKWAREALWAAFSGLSGTGGH
jgi:hypothetical protein